MRRHEKTNHLGIKIGLILLLVLIIIFVFGKPFSSNKNNDIDEVWINDSLINLNEQEYLDVELVGDMDDLDPELCEEYAFREGDKLTIAKQEVVLEGISGKSIKISVDGEIKLISEGSGEIFEEGLKIELVKGQLFYLEAGSEHNLAELMIGCGYGEEPITKYVKDMGREACDASYNECLIAFDLK